MLSIHKTVDGVMTRLDQFEENCWVHLTYPSEDELEQVITKLKVDPGLLRAALDEEETSRIDSEEDQTLIIIDLPSVEKDDAVIYSTKPITSVISRLSSTLGIGRLAFAAPVSFIDNVVLLSHPCAAALPSLMEDTMQSAGIT